MIRYLTEFPEPFDPDTVRTLGVALDDAWVRAQASAVRFDGRAHEARMMLAELIVVMAKRGERNQERLVEQALVRFRL